MSSDYTYRAEQGMAWLDKYYIPAQSPPKFSVLEGFIDLARNAIFMAMAGRKLFVLWSAEAIDAYAEFFEACKAKRVVEVGAGDGRLSAWLRRAGLGAIATDNFSWKIPVVAPVKRLPVERLPGLAPTQGIQGIICSWPPYQSDWTQIFNTCGLPYILIGEPYGCTGVSADWECPSGWQEKGLVAPVVGRTDEWCEWAVKRIPRTVSVARVLPRCLSIRFSTLA